MSTILLVIKVQGDKWNFLQGGSGDNISLNWDSKCSTLSNCSVYMYKVYLSSQYKNRQLTPKLGNAYAKQMQETQVQSLG